jgi:hypothetical protein
MEKDWEGMTDALTTLAYTPGDQELNDLTDKHIKETKQKRESMQILDSGYVVADKYTLGLKSLAYLKERNFELYRHLRVTMKAKGYLEGSRGIAEKDFKTLEDDDGENDE